MQLTHFVPRPPESEAWVQVAFFVSTDIPDSFLCGFDTKRPISAEDLNERVENGTTEKLLCRVDIDESKRVWISPACDIWVADAQYPLGDKNKQRAKKGAGPAMPSRTRTRAAGTTAITSITSGMTTRAMWCTPATAAPCSAPTRWTAAQA